MTRTSKRTLLALGLLAVLVALVTPGTDAQVANVSPALVGQWTEPFEEGGAGAPRCITAADGSLECKPAAVNLTTLPDGRILYFNGFEGSENQQGPALNDLAPSLRNGQVRLLDLRGGTPSWTTPTETFGGGRNADHAAGRTAADDPLGAAGVPGRPGDGLVGSTWGAAGGPGHNPSANPDDVEANDEEMFCADLAGLPDGRILIAGGIDWYNEPEVMDENRGDPANLGVVELSGLRNTRVFDPATNSFVQAETMHHPRWYPTLVPLADGKVLAASGVTKLIKSTQLSNIRRTETFDPETLSWTENYVGPASENTMPFQARLHLMPNGKVLYTGSGQSWAPFGQAVDEALWGIQQFFDPASKIWEPVGLGPFGVARDYPYSVMLPLDPPYDRATVLEFGGALGPSPGGYLAVPFATLTTVDERGRVTNEMTTNLNEPRWSSSGIPLPDGTVLAVGGARNSHPLTPGLDVALRTVEQYDPATRRWTQLAPASRDRAYHYTATLLADGRVLLGGGAPIGTMYGPHGDAGGPFANNDKDSSFQVFSPPYLFRGPRPSITRAPAGIAWGDRFEIGTPQAADVESVVLIRLPSQQHVNDSDARTIRPAFTPTGPGRLEVTAPPGGTVAPPGYYYLFVTRSTPDGPVPSVARMVRIGATGDPSEALQPFPDQAPMPTGGTATPDEDSSRSTAIRREMATPGRRGGR